MSDLPQAMGRYLPDSDFRVVVWTSQSGELVVEIEKEIGPEKGIAKFAGVSFVNLPASMTVYAMEVRSPKELPNDFWNPTTPAPNDLDEDDLIFVIDGSWGGRNFVVAKSVSYEVMG
jgi:hypothetical protein